MQGSAHEYRTATFGAGCFWGVEDTFKKVSGVVGTVVGYMGGSVEHPTYEEVCTGATGHAEVVEVMYDSTKVGYDTLLDVFWSVHDPTQKGGQGLDIGTQYRSVIFYHTDAERVSAETSRIQQQMSGRYGNRIIITEIVPATKFWRAEEYHQGYIEKHEGQVCG